MFGNVTDNDTENNTDNGTGNIEENVTENGAGKGRMGLHKKDFAGRKNNSFHSEKENSL